MNEKGNKRREWIKTAAIIFLSVMLVLTFFSNSIMNYSLPEVATQYVMSGSITARVRGTGMVESGDPYNIEITESRKVASVAVRVGDEVQKGDVLLYLEETESTELKDAMDALETMQDALQDAWDNYYAAMLTETITAEDIQAANSNTSATTYRRQITAAQEAIKPWEDKVAELEKNIAAIDAQMALESGLDSSADERVTSTKSAMDTAKTKLDNAETALKNAKKALDAAVSSGDAAAKQAQTNYDNAKTARDNAKAAYDDAVTAYNNAVSNQDGRKGSQTNANLTAQRAQYEMELYKAQAELAAAQQNLADLITLVSNKLNLDTYQEAIADAQKGVDKAQELVDELTEKSVASTVTADISGTVTAVNVVAGNTTSPNSPLVVLQPEGQGYTMSFSVTDAQARRLAVGDRADLVNAWRYYDVEVVLASIKPDPDSPGQNKLLTFNVSGGVVAGQTLSVSVGQQSANFDLIVPNSAIREDNNGKFILIVESRSTPLGNRYSASRVDVEVLASDDTQSAISGALYGYEYVITTSTKPVEAGQLVRLANN